MRKRLIFLALALAAAAAGTYSPASAATCPKNSHPIDCGTYVLCCPTGAFCVCSPF